jgi:hypothetical protein
MPTIQQLVRLNRTKVLNATKEGKKNGDAALMPKSEVPKRDLI